MLSQLQTLKEHRRIPFHRDAKPHLPRIDRVNGRSTRSLAAVDASLARGAN